MGKSITNIEPKAMETLKSYHWPGNVRELANVLERAVVLGEGETLVMDDLPQNLFQASPSPPAATSGTETALPEEIDQIEKQRIIEALKKAQGNKSEAARLLGLKRSTFYGKLRKFHLL